MTPGPGPNAGRNRALIGQIIAALVAIIPASCVGTFTTSMTPASSNVARNQSFAFGYRVLHRFEGGYDGEQPEAGLAVAGAKLYGTTTYGGVGCASDGCGTLYDVTPTGAFHTLYRFSGPSSGASTALPVATLLSYSRELYGTTSGLGAPGAVFRSTPAGKVDYLHEFAGGADGGSPQTPIAVLNGELYGTTGGYDNPGTVYKVNVSGHLLTIYHFKGGTDGSDPTGLVAVNGEFYGGTYSGGKSGRGTLFKISPAGKERTIYSFRPPHDGQGPAASMILFKGMLYGTTVGGGAYDAGTIYKIDPVTNKESVVYSFAGGHSNPDGANPSGSLIAVNGNLYGTTYAGGVIGSGTVFELTPAGEEQVIHNFGPSGDGSEPVAGLAELGGKLYGTTTLGGVCCGTIFTIKPL